jgi:hypothetical protein
VAEGDQPGSVSAVRIRCRPPVPMCDFHFFVALMHSRTGWFARIEVQEIRGTLGGGANLPTHDH